MKASDLIIRSLDQSNAMLTILLNEENYLCLGEHRLVEVMANIESRLKEIYDGDKHNNLTDEDCTILNSVDDIHEQAWQARGLMTLITGNDIVCDMDNNIIGQCLENVQDRVKTALSIIHTPNTLQVSQTNKDIAIN